MGRTSSTRRAPAVGSRLSAPELGTSGGTVLIGSLSSSRTTGSLASMHGRQDATPPRVRSRSSDRYEQRSAQSSEWIVNATANPSVVTTPTSLPPCSNASGIIVSASIVRIAPAAKASTKATTSGEEFWKSAVAGERGERRDHRDRDPHPEDPRLLPAAADEAGGRGDRLGQVGDEDRGQIGGAHRPALVDRQADHHRLRDAVEHGSEHDRERRAALLASVRILPRRSRRGGRSASRRRRRPRSRRRGRR